MHATHRVYTKTHFEAMNKRIQMLEKMLKTARGHEDGLVERPEEPIAREVESSSIIPARDCSPPKPAGLPVNTACSLLEHPLLEDSRNKHARAWEEVNFPELVDIMDLPPACSSAMPRYCISPLLIHPGACVADDAIQRPVWRPAHRA
jgi:hypothetical protein